MLWVVVSGWPTLAESVPQARVVDVSHHSGEVSWPKVRDAGLEVAYIKATEGVDAQDPRFEDNWRRAREAGLLRGAYHFYVTEDDPREQADFFLATVPVDDRGELVPVVDVEVIGRGTVDDWGARLGEFLARLEKAFGVAPMIYTSPNFWSRHGSDLDFEGYPLWIAQYETESPRVPAPWTAWTLWQWAGDQTLSGVEKEVDLSTYAGTDLPSTLRLTPVDGDAK